MEPTWKPGIQDIQHLFLVINRANHFNYANFLKPLGSVSCTEINIFMDIVCNSFTTTRQKNPLIAHLNSSFRVAFVRGQLASRRSCRTFKSSSPEEQKCSHLLCPTLSSIVSCCASVVCPLLLQIGSVPQQKLHVSDVAMRASCTRGKVHR